MAISGSLLAIFCLLGAAIATAPPTMAPSSSAPSVSVRPSVMPTVSPSRTPTARPTYSPTISIAPSTIRPTYPTVMPTTAPSGPTVSPTTAVPTYFSPTPIPTPFRVVDLTEDPIAQHQLVVVPPSGNAVIRLKYYDPATSLFQFATISLPSSGKISQLSQVYSKYGYEPKNGAVISAVPANITGSNNRLYYARPTPDYATNQKWDSFDYVALRYDGMVSSVGTVTIVPPSGAIVGSSFLLNNEAWSIVGNREPMSATFEPYSRGALLNYYVMGSDDLINVDSSTSPDRDLWYFQAPAKFLGNFGISYGGTLAFTLASFSGDFSSLNDPKVNVVVLECATCNGPVGKGITLGFSLKALLTSRNGAFTGSAKRITVSLLEGAGWLKDSQNTLKPWTVPSKCDIIQVLSRLSAVRILGDWTTWYESIGLDDVQIANTQAQLPLCAMSVPDASICSC